MEGALEFVVLAEVILAAQDGADADVFGEAGKDERQFLGGRDDFAMAQCEGGAPSLAPQISFAREIIAPVEFVLQGVEDVVVFEWRKVW